jgi:hypothetical protein
MERATLIVTPGTSEICIKGANSSALFLNFGLLEKQTTEQILTK